MSEQHCTAVTQQTRDALTEKQISSDVLSGGEKKKKDTTHFCTKAVQVETSIQKVSFDSVKTV